MLAAEEGHLDTLKWLHENYNITKADTKYKYNYAYRMAYQNSYLDVLKWLHETFKITKDDNLDFVLESLKK